MTFAYYEKDQADQYSFIRIPKAMMTEDREVQISWLHRSSLHTDHVFLRGTCPDPDSCFSLA